MSVLADEPSSTAIAKLPIILMKLREKTFARSTATFHIPAWLRGRCAQKREALQKRPAKKQQHAQKAAYPKAAWPEKAAAAKERLRQKPCAQIALAAG